MKLFTATLISRCGRKVGVVPKFAYSIAIFYTLIEDVVIRSAYTPLFRVTRRPLLGGSKHTISALPLSKQA